MKLLSQLILTASQIANSRLGNYGKTMFTGLIMELRDYKGTICNQLYCANSMSDAVLKKATDNQFFLLWL